MSRVRQVSLQTVITLLVCLVVVLSLAITGILIGMKEAQTARSDLSEKVMDVAHMVANTPLVIAALDGKGNPALVEPFTTKLEHVTNVRFIVVMNMQHIRLSHPNEQLIGKPFVGGDEFKALQGATYVSIARGTLGTSMRAFVPVRDASGKQVGVVSVGIMMDKVRTTVSRSEGIIYLGVGIGTLVGVFGAFLLARRIKRTLFGLEPHEIAKLLQERTAMLEAVREAILAIDTEGRIVVANRAAQEMLREGGMSTDPVGQDVEAILPPSRLPHVIESGIPEYDQELHINGRTLIINRVPVTVGQQVVGAVATFRDKSELKALIEQLTGVKLYADALRVQTHEFMNKLHVILGIVRLQRYDQLSTYITDLTHRYQFEVGAVSRLVQDPALAGFLLSKLSYARERGAALNIVQPDGNYGRIPENPSLTDELITILGNLIDNAIEAVEVCEQKNVNVELLYQSSTLVIRVTDSGVGIQIEIRNRMFEKGASTKGENRGFGLFLVKQHVEKLHGALTYASNAQGTVFTVSLPYGSEGGNNDDSGIGR